jgi:hypothetical protein
MYKIIREEETKEIQEVAKIKNPINNVNIKSKDKTVWFPAEESAKLELNDSVATGINSSSEIVFKEGYLISLGDNSLIEIRMPDESEFTEIELSYGTLSVVNENEQDARIKIKIGEVVANVGKQSKFQITTTQDKTELKVEAGEVELKDSLGNKIVVDDKKEKTIKIKDEKFIIEDIEEIPITITDKEPLIDKKERPKEEEKVIKKYSIQTSNLYKAVSEKQEQLSTCYYRMTRPTKETPMVNMEVIVESDGKISDAKIINTNIEEEEIKTCLVFWLKQVDLKQITDKPIKRTINLYFK